MGANDYCKGRTKNSLSSQAPEKLGSFSFDAVDSFEESKSFCLKGIVQIDKHLDAKI